MIILGVDPSTSNVGVGVIRLNNNEIELVAMHSLNPRSKDIFERYKSIYGDISNLAEVYKPDYAGIEDQWSGINKQTLIKLSFVTGLTWAGVHTHPDAKIDIIYPTTWRKLALGSGKAKKEDVIEFVTDKFGLKTDKKTLSDPYEAVGIAIAVARRIADKEELTFCPVESPAGRISRDGTNTTRAFSKIEER